MTNLIIASSARRRVPSYMLGRWPSRHEGRTSRSSCGLSHLHSCLAPCRGGPELSSISTCTSPHSGGLAKNRRYMSTSSGNGKDSAPTAGRTFNKSSGFSSSGKLIDRILDHHDRGTSHTNKLTATPTGTAAIASAADVFDRIVYVHPLSQIILEFFQNHWSDWLVEHGLDRSLTIHRDGTFELVFASESDCSPEDNVTSSEPLVFLASSAKYKMDNRIWTSYDEEEKKHWMTVRKDNLRKRFLLQDNLAGTGTWHGRGGDRNTTEQRLHKAVNEMIQAVNDQVRVKNLRLQQEQYQKKKEQVDRQLYQRSVDTPKSDADASLVGSSISSDIPREDANIDNSGDKEET